MPAAIPMIGGILSGVGAAQTAYNGVNSATGGALEKGIGGLIGGQRGNQDPAQAMAANNRSQAMAQKRAYDEMINRGQGQMDTGENQFLQEANSPVPEFQQAQQNLANKQDQGYKELQTGLEQQGVRGGQAATQLRRGAGDLENNLNDMAFKEAQQRQQSKLGYFGNKAQVGQRATNPGQPAPLVLQ